MGAGNGSVALATLKDEVVSAIASITEKEGKAGCVAHDGMARGLVALLRVESARISSQMEDAKGIVVEKRAFWGRVFSGLVLVLVGMIFGEFGSSLLRIAEMIASKL